MQNLIPTRAIARAGRNTMIAGALVLLAGLVIGAISVLIGLLFSASGIALLFLIAGGLVALVGFVIMIRGITLRRENDGAVALASALGGALDNTFTLIRNVNRRGLGYVDAILIGPPGVLVFRTVEKTGTFLNEGADWLERQGGEPFKLSRLNATRECVTDVYALRNYLAARQLANVPVYALICFTAQGVQVSARQPVVPVADLRNLLAVMRSPESGYLREARLEPQVVDQTVRAIYE